MFVLPCACGAAGGELLGRRAAAFSQVASLRSLLLDLLRRLPEKQIRRDRRAENRHQHREERSRPLDVRNQRGAERKPPVHVRDKRGQHIGEQHEREPLEHARDRAVRGPHQQHDDDDAVGRDGERDRRARDHPGGLRHAAEIRRNVDHVGDDQQQAGSPQHPARIAPPDHAGETEASDNAEPGAHQLHGGHERERHDRRPQRQVAEAGAGHRVGRNARRVVVRRAGDQAGSQFREEMPEGALVARLGRGCFHRRQYSGQGEAAKPWSSRAPSFTSTS